MGDLTYGDEPVFCQLAEKNSRENGMIEIIVEDTGTGIKVEDRGALFTLFGYLDRTKAINSRGIGLGLHICRMIVR